MQMQWAEHVATFGARITTSLFEIKIILISATSNRVSEIGNHRYWASNELTAGDIERRRPSTILITNIRLSFHTRTKPCSKITAKNIGFSKTLS